MVTDVATQLSFVGQTLTGSLGVRFGGTLGVSVEYLESRHILAVTRARAKVSNWVDGQRQGGDRQEETVESLFRGLEGERFHHSTRSLVIGVSFQPQ